MSEPNAQHAIAADAVEGSRQPRRYPAWLAATFIHGQGRAWRPHVLKVDGNAAVDDPRDSRVIQLALEAVAAEAGGEGQLGGEVAWRFES